MTIEGIWTGELYGPYGWENTGVYVLEQGRMLGGNDRHYSTGRYRLDGSAFRAEVAVQYYGPPRAIFGDKRETFDIQVAGELSDDVIDATISRDDRPGYDVQYRLTRRIDIPPV
ncbi:MAG: GrlR family regulatory protein [Pseudomonadota bacterium]